MLRRTMVALALVMPMLACSDTTEFQLRGGVQVSFATQNPTVAMLAAAAAPAVALDDTIAMGGDTLIITRAQLVLREIELKAAATVDCDAEPEPMGCEEIEVGPVLVDLPLTPGAAKEFELELPAGAYSRIDFEVHKVSSGSAEDAAFIAAHPEFEDLSIRVQGSFNGAAFTFESDLDVEQELTLSPPITVTDSLPTNVTIRVDLATWFRDAAGTLVDPSTANKGGDNEGIVTTNITQSLKAFEDADRDGDERDEG